ncbi:sugar-transfer associated ATP-grasp domain-containing protein [Dongia sp.]|uniref:sugar-transfer associated ATP-grasp domain-containing protein n=1 Tax=Dongia sp. TaxID=1977262 RepID=UPI0035AE52A4
MNRLHKVHYRAIWKSRTLLGKLQLIFCLLLWPALMLPRILYSIKHNAARVSKISGKSALRQFCELYCLTARFGFRPDVYYKMELYLPERAARAGGFVNRNATKDSIYRLLKPSDRRWSPLTDKVTFATYCLEHGISVAPILASLRDGRVDGFFAGLPKKDIFVKRTRGRGGVKAELWRWENGTYRNKEGEALDEQALVNRFIERSRAEPYLIQERLINDDRLKDLAQGALATVRLVSALNEVGQPEPIRAIFRMPSKSDSIVDNFHAGGIAANVDLGSGKLGPATDMGLKRSLGWVDVHPISNAPITGRTLPEWPEMLKAVLDAHKEFADRAVIGWDVALTDQGIVIVEGNAASDTDIIQRCCRAPLSDSRYPELVLWHLKQLGRLY